jgi:hypothetical protein
MAKVAFRIGIGATFMKALLVARADFVRYAARDMQGGA